MPWSWLVLTVAGLRVWGLILLHTGTDLPPFVQSSSMPLPQPGEPGACLHLASPPGGFEHHGVPGAIWMWLGAGRSHHVFWSWVKTETPALAPAHPFRPKEMGSGSSGRMEDVPHSWDAAADVG